MIFISLPLYISLNPYTAWDLTKWSVSFVVYNVGDCCASCSLVLRRRCRFFISRFICAQIKATFKAEVVIFLKSIVLAARAYHFLCRGMNLSSHVDKKPRLASPTFRRFRSSHFRGRSQKGGSGFPELGILGGGTVGLSGRPTASQVPQVLFVQ